MSVLGAQRLGSWRLIRRIAIGGMAELFEASWDDGDRDPPNGLRAGQLVCLKRPLPHVTEDPDLSLAFEAVGRLALGVHHPHIVRTLAVERVPWGACEPYIVMELVEGEPLSALLGAALESGEPVPPARVAELGAMIASALACLHELLDESGEPLGFVHRDVTPQNIVVRADGSAVLVDLDMGWFHNRPGHTATGAVKGKHAYASPESFGEGRVDQRSDLFSLGVVLWELVAARRLFLRSDVMETMESVQSASVPDLAELVGGVPPALTDVLSACLARSGDDRPQGARLVAEQLRSVADAGSGLLPAGATSGTSLPPAMHPVTAIAVVAGAALIVAFVLATSLWYVGQVAP